VRRRWNTPANRAAVPDNGDFTANTLEQIKNTQEFLNVAARESKTAACAAAVRADMGLIVMTVIR